MSRTATTSLKESFGRRLSLLREGAGLTQSAMARACGVSAVYYGTLERAEKAVSIDVIEKLAQGLGITPAALFDVGARIEAADPTELLARRIALLARGSTAAKLDRFERIAVAFFESEERPPSRRARRRG